MRYKKFIINGYRGLAPNTEINISKYSILPIIGKNESGKTTCLEAIFAFDHVNDAENNSKHISNVENLYSTSKQKISITAEIEIDKDTDLQSLFGNTLSTFLESVKSFSPELDFDLDGDNKIDLSIYENNEFYYSYRLLKTYVDENRNINISRDLLSSTYSIDIFEAILDNNIIDEIAKNILKNLPYTLYFDDFRDRIPERIYITEDKDSPLYSSWILYINELFKDTKDEYTVFDIPERQVSVRRSIIREVQKHLNKKLISEWSSYQFESSNSINIQIEFNDSGETPHLEFKLIETININGVEEERFFDISDRSKGFYWYFNFMIKLHFNPNKREKEDNDTIYLLDEPGSYLHSYAQTKLAEQISKLSKNNKVIYCTHSHNLLNPEFIPMNSIRLSEKDSEGVIRIKPAEHKGIIRRGKNSAFQSIFDALEIKPPLIEYDYDNIILVEGIYDYYTFKLFTNSELNYFPCAGASTIINQIPFMIFLGKNYLALWDNDKEGRERLEKAKELYGIHEANKFLTLLDLEELGNVSIENYYDNTELQNYKNHINQVDMSFEKTIVDLYYSPNKSELIKKYFIKTQSNINKMEDLIKGMLFSKDL